MFTSKPKNKRGILHLSEKWDKMLKYKLKIRKQRRWDIWGCRVHEALPTLNERIHNRRDNRGNKAFRSKLAMTTPSSFTSCSNV